MSTLHVHARPWVMFDPTDIQHRRWLHDVKCAGTWGVCPVRFVLSTGAGSLMDRCNTSIMNYYMDKEFSDSVKDESVQSA